jgi:hypothetical protein
MALERTILFRSVAAAMAVVLVGFTAAMAGPASVAVSGTVIVGIDKKPLEGATIHLSTSTGQLTSSGRTDLGGNFQIDNVEAATYEVAVEYDGGLYLVGSPVTVGAHQPLMLNLAIERSASAAKPATRAQRGAGGLLASPLAASLLVAGSALTVGALIESTTTDDDDPLASYFLVR